MVPQLYIVPSAVYSLSILGTIAIGLAIGLTWWWLAALPFIYLGEVCAAPNMNMADGFLAWLALFIGLIVLTFCLPLGMAICTGTMLSYVTSVCEKTMRMRPATVRELRP